MLVCSGTPGIFIKHVVDGVVQLMLAPRSGLAANIIKPASGEMVDDPGVALVRAANPDDAP